ncbi:IQ motif and SEC7 domain-containing protein 1 isoform X3 [Bemisia tabaci]|uniref:IQ motif and SEC7 domain-containing protein 1 isoform X3 n=2 Tax=Bemisia tabaci TaxID=7038 RepID=UPI003B27B3D7
MDLNASGNENFNDGYDKSMIRGHARSDNMTKEREQQPPHATYINGNLNGTLETDTVDSGERACTSSVYQCHGWSQSLTKKSSVRNSTELKRCRVQNVRYELSQDLLDKQIEVLERKYGGVKARTAAIVIQRAFRHYMLLKKFAHITAMAKAERRLSRRIQNFEESERNLCPLPEAEYEIHSTPPLRSMSLREHRNTGFHMPRSYSGRCDLTYYSSSSQHYYSPQQFFADHNKNGLSPEPPLSRAANSSPSPDTSTMRSLHRKVPPEVPKRTSSITLRCMDTPNQSFNTSGTLTLSGSLSSVQSSGSDTPPQFVNSPSPAPPPATWSKKIPVHEQMQSTTSLPVYHHEVALSYKISETVRKRQYRVGLNLFNKKPEKGIAYLVRRGFLENTPQGVARFFISRKGLSKQMIGEYLGNLQAKFNNAVLECFAEELDLSGMQVDVALRKFQTYLRLPGEAQKIERLMEVFSHRYCHCNRDVLARLRSPDTVFVLAFAIIMLNTDLHTPNLKPERRMKLDDFIKNLRGVDDCHDVDRDMLVGIYERVKANEFKPGSDHVTQVLKVQSTIVGKKPNLAVPHRRLVCYCRLYEVLDINKKEKHSLHQREVFLFNDLLVITKILSKKKNSVTYTFRKSFPLSGLVVTLFESTYYPFGIKLSQKVDSQLLIIFNARNDHDRCKFAEDIRESISEMDEMENLRIESELERQKSSRVVRSSSNNGSPDNRDSGVADVEVCPLVSTSPRNEPASIKLPVDNPAVLKRSALSNSLLDIHDQFGAEKGQRRGSVGSLDSGMSVSFQSTSASTVSRDSSPQSIYPKMNNVPVSKNQSSFLGGLFAKRERKSSRAEEIVQPSRSTEV